MDTRTSPTKRSLCRTASSKLLHLKLYRESESLSLLAQGFAVYLIWVVPSSVLVRLPDCCMCVPKAISHLYQRRQRLTPCYRPKGNRRDQWSHLLEITAAAASFNYIHLLRLQLETFAYTDIRIGLDWTPLSADRSIDSIISKHLLLSTRLLASSLPLGLSFYQDTLSDSVGIFSLDQNGKFYESCKWPNKTPFVCFKVIFIFFVICLIFFFIYSATGDSLYIILGVEKTAAPDDIKRSYRKVNLFIFWYFLTSWYFYVFIFM